MQVRQIWGSSKWLGVGYEPGRVPKGHRDRAAGQGAARPAVTRTEAVPRPRCRPAPRATAHLSGLQRPGFRSSGAGGALPLLSPNPRDACRGRTLPAPYPSPGCCCQRGTQPLKRPRPLGPSAVTASSATRPMTSPGTCPAASIAATLSARRACGGWLHRPPSSAGSPARSAARARPCPVEGWPCWTSTWPPSWPSGPGGGRLAWSRILPGPARAAPLLLSNRPGSSPRRTPCPASPSPEAAAWPAAASAGIPQAAPSSERCSAPPLGREPWPAARGTGFPKQPRVLAPGPPSKVVSCAHSAVHPCRSWNPGQAPGPMGVCVPCGGAAVRVPRAQGRSGRSSEAAPATVWGPVSGPGLQAGGQAQQRPLLACWRRAPPYRALSPAGGSLPSPSVKPTRSLPPAPGVSGAVWGGQARWLLLL